MRKMTVYMTDHTDSQYRTEERALRCEIEEEVDELIKTKLIQSPIDINFLNPNKVRSFIINNIDQLHEIVHRKRTVTDETAKQYNNS